VIAPLAAFALLALIIGERRLPLLLAGVACVAVSLFWIGRAASAQIAAEQQRAARRWRSGSRASCGDSGSGQGPGSDDGPAAPGTWDVDGFRKPRGLIAATARSTRNV